MDLAPGGFEFDKICLKELPGCVFARWNVSDTAEEVPLSTAELRRVTHVFGADLVYSGAVGGCGAGLLEALAHVVRHSPNAQACPHMHRRATVFCRTRHRVKFSLGRSLLLPLSPVATWGGHAGAPHPGRSLLRRSCCSPQRTSGGGRGSSCQRIPPRSRD
jgi:hypothetical protein